MACRQAVFIACATRRHAGEDAGGQASGGDVAVRKQLAEIEHAGRHAGRSCEILEVAVTEIAHVILLAEKPSAILRRERRIEIFDRLGVDADRRGEQMVAARLDRAVEPGQHLGDVAGDVLQNMVMHDHVIMFRRKLSEIAAQVDLQDRLAPFGEQRGIVVGALITVSDLDPAQANHEGLWREIEHSHARAQQSEP